MHIAFVFNLKRSDKVEEAEFDTEDVIEAIAKGLGANGDQVTKIEMTKDGSWVDELKKANPDLVFNTAEGFFGAGREAYAPTVFEQLQLPYVGSGPYACFITLDKFLTKKVVEDKGVNTPESFFVTNKNELETVAGELPYPVFVKPNFEGSSKGITSRSYCQTREEFLSYAGELVSEYPEGILVERFIDGKDVTVPFVEGLGKNDGVLEVVEYTGTTKGDLVIYDYEMKNAEDSTVDVLCPANIESETREKIIEQMKLVVDSLGIVDMCRADFRVTPNGEVYFIEVNALPSLQPGAGLFSASEKENLNYQQTIQAIVTSAARRNKTTIKRVFKSRKIKTRLPNLALVYNVKKKKPEEEGYEDEAEFDSQHTIDSIATALKNNGHTPVLIEADRDLAKNLLSNEIEVVFNIAEGMHKQSREAQVPALCDLLGIEHTGSDAACLSITLNKALSTKMVLSEKLDAPRSIVFNSKKKNYQHDLQYPVIIKPNLEGTSKGIYDNSVVNDEAELNERLAELFDKLKGPMMVEEFIKGREFTVGLIGEHSPQVIGISEVVFKNDHDGRSIYSFEAKSLDNQLDNDVFKIVSPADIEQTLEKKIIKTSKKIFKITGCRDVARIDYRISSDNKIYFIEVNPLPGLSPGFSDLTIMAEKNGLSYDALIGKIVTPAVRRWRKNI
jgi:D-alanine-D-alanine ligase